MNPTPDEFDATMLAKGFVRQPDGSYSKAARAGTARDSGAAEQKPEGPAAHDRPNHPAQLSHTELQKFESRGVEESSGQTAGPPVLDYETGTGKVDGESRPTFRIEITLHVSNRMRRDPTGALETICDVITATRRRLSERLDPGFVEGGDVRARKRRRNSGDNKALVKVPF